MSTHVSRFGFMGEWIFAREYRENIYRVKSQFPLTENAATILFFFITSEELLDIAGSNLEHTSIHSQSGYGSGLLVMTYVHTVRQCVNIRIPTSRAVSLGPWVLWTLQSLWHKFMGWKLVINTSSLKGEWGYVHHTETKFILYIFTPSIFVLFWVSPGWFM